MTSNGGGVLVLEEVLVLLVEDARVAGKSATDFEGDRRRHAIAATPQIPRRGRKGVRAQKKPDSNHA